MYEWMTTRRLWACAGLVDLPVKDGVESLMGKEIYLIFSSLLVVLFISRQRSRTRPASGIKYG